MRKPPTRKSNEISQTYNSGILTVFSVRDAAEPGYAPVKKLTRKVQLRFEEIQLGLTRYYSALQNNVRVERVLRCPYRPEVSPQDVVVTTDGRQYQVELVQKLQDVWPVSMDLTLSRIDQKYDVSKLDTGEEAGR